MRWTLAEFQALPQVTVRSDIHCVTRWSRFDNEWRGVAFAEVMRQVGAKPEARFAVIHAEQGFTTNLALAELIKDDVLFAWQHDGADLTPEHGWPLRLVVPRRYFWKSAKWVRGIELTAERPSRLLGARTATTTKPTRGARSASRSGNARGCRRPHEPRHAGLARPSSSCARWSPSCASWATPARAIRASSSGAR